MHFKDKIIVKIFSTGLHAGSLTSEKKKDFPKRKIILYFERHLLSTDILLVENPGTIFLYIQLLLL